MKRIVGLVSISAIIFLLLPITILAKSNSNPRKIVTLGPNETVDHDYFAAGEIVEISGTVNGDVYAAGGQVLIDGVVNGDLLAAGGTVNVTGTITQDVRVVGGQVIVSGNIGRNVSLAGGNIEVSNDANIVGNIAAGGGNINLNAPIGKNVTIGAGNLNINDTISGNLMAGVGTLRLSSKAQIGGDVTYWSEEDASIAEDATILGKIEKKSPPNTRPAMDSKKTMAGVNIFIKLTSLVSTLIIGLIIIRLYPNLTNRTTKLLNERNLVSLAAGFALLILAPIAAFIVMFTIIGLPVGIIMIGIWMFYLYVGRIFVIIWGGEKIISYFKDKAPLGLSLIVGIIAYYILISLPFVGWLVKFIVLILGLGALSIACKNTYKLERKEKII